MMPGENEKLHLLITLIRYVKKDTSALSDFRYVQSKYISKFEL